MMPDRETERFFDLWHEHSMSDWRFYGSRAGAEWFRELRHLAAQIPTENWREYALWLVGEAGKAAERRFFRQSGKRACKCAESWYSKHDAPLRGIRVGI